MRKNILLADIIKNPKFDVNAKIAVYETDGDRTWQDTEPVWTNQCDKEPSWVHMLKEVNYITVTEKCELIIEISKTSDIEELIGQLIDNFEDFLDSKKETPDNEVNIKGDDYDALAQNIEKILRNWSEYL